MKSLKSHEVAAREAFEEAGPVGRIIGMYRDAKRSRSIVSSSETAGFWRSQS